MTWHQTKTFQKQGKRMGKEGKESGVGGILEPVRETSAMGTRYYSCPYEPCQETVISIEGMRSHIKQVHELVSYRCKYCSFTTKNFDSLKQQERGCKGAYDLD